MEQVYQHKILDMESFEAPVLTTTVGCDESQCASTGRSGNGTFVSFTLELTCYGDRDGILFPMMCANGFVPVVVEDEPPVVVTGMAGFGLGGVRYSFTSLVVHRTTSTTKPPPKQ